MPIEKDIRFILRDPKSAKDSLIYLKYTCYDGVMKYYIGGKVSTERDPADNLIYWDEGIQRPKDKKAYKTLDRQITRLTSVAVKFITDKEKAGERVLSMELYNYLASSEPDRKEQKTSTELSIFFSQVKELINDAKSGAQTIYASGDKNGNMYSKGTIIHWELAYNKLYEFDPNLSWNISMKDYNRFLFWCNKKGFRKNYTGTIIKMWKVFMNLGLEKEWHKNVVHLNKSFRKLHERPDKDYLRESEIQALVDLDLVGIKKDIRDSFVINCENGLRISDQSKLTMEKNYKNGKITCINVKTNETSSIPAGKHTKRILEELGHFPNINPKTGKPYAEFTINRIIKELGELAGLNRKVEFVETVGGVPTPQTKPMFELITCHTARRSAITNLLRRKIPIQDIAKFVGSKVKNVEYYNKEKAEDAAERYKDSEHFK
jgi:hypothetical protein